MKCVMSFDPQVCLDYSCFPPISLPLMHTCSLDLKHSLDVSRFTAQALCKDLNEKILVKGSRKKTPGLPSVSPAD